MCAKSEGIFTSFFQLCGFSSQIHGKILTLSDLLDKPLSQVPSVLPLPGTQVPSFLSWIGPVLSRAKKTKKKRNEKTKNRTKEYVSFIGQIIKIRSRDPDTSVFTFRFF